MPRSDAASSGLCMHDASDKSRWARVKRGPTNYVVFLVKLNHYIGVELQKRNKIKCRHSALRCCARPLWFYGSSTYFSTSVKNAPMPSWTTTSAILSSGVGSRLIITSSAPFIFASRGK